MLAIHLPGTIRHVHKPSKDLMHLFLSAVSRRVAMTFLWVFSSVFIYEVLINYGVQKTYALAFVIIYYLLMFTVKLFTFVYSEDLSRKIGFKGTIKLSVLPFLLFLPAIIFSQDYMLLLIPAAILMGLHIGLFWWGYHGYFIKTASKDHYGESLGEAGLLETLAVIATPFIGAVVITTFGYTAMFLLVAVFMVVSLVLLGKDHDKKQKQDIKYFEVLKLIKSHKSITTAYAGSSAEGTIYIVLWPVFLFLFFGQVLSLGKVVSLAALIASVFAIIIGSWADKQGERKVVGIGSPLVSLSWIVRLFITTPFSFVLTDSVWNFGQKMVGLPLNALTYKKALSEKGSAMAILFRETALVLGSLMSLGVVLVFILVGLSVKAAFFIAAIFSLFPLIAVYKKRLQGK